MALDESLVGTGPIGIIFSFFPRPVSSETFRCDYQNFDHTSEFTALELILGSFCFPHRRLSVGYNSEQALCKEKKEIGKSKYITISHKNNCDNKLGTVGEISRELLFGNHGKNSIKKRRFDIVDRY